MAAIIQAAVAMILWIATHRDDIKNAVVGVEQLLSDAPGVAKAQAVRGFIVAGMQAEGVLEQDIEKVWPFVGPTFDKFVAKVKSGSPAASAG